MALDPRIANIVGSIAAEARDLQSQIQAIKDAAGRDGTALQDAFNDANECYARKPERVRALVKEAKELCDEEPPAWTGGDLTEIRNRWEAVDRKWARLKAVRPDTPPTSDQAKAISDRADQVAAALYDLVTNRAVLVARVNSVLASRFVGKAIPFEDVFGSEFTDVAQRKLVTDRLVNEEAEIQGVVEPVSGTMYKISPSRAVRLLTYALPAFFAVLAAGALVLLAQLDNWNVVGDGWPNGLSNAHDLVRTYVLVLVGALVHLFVERTKQIQNPGQQIVVVGDTLRWLHLRWGGLSLSLAYVVVTVIGLEVSSQDEWLTALAAGYASDSIAGLFIGRFADIAGTRLAALRAVVSVGGSGGSSATGGSTAGGGSG